MKSRCFPGKFSQLAKILHDRRSRRSRQISSLSEDDTNQLDDDNDDDDDDDLYMCNADAQSVCHEK